MRSLYEAESHWARGYENGGWGGDGGGGGPSPFPHQVSRSSGKIPGRVKTCGN
jgi:hypothetical protein